MCASSRFATMWRYVRSGAFASLRGRYRISTFANAESCSYQKCVTFFGALSPRLDAA
jgi:hypothetical protein